MAKNVAAPKGKTVKKVRAVPIVWVGMDSLPVLAVNNMISQFEGDLFVLTFGMVNSPVIIGSKEDVVRQVESINSVTVTPVARLAMTEAQMERTAQALQENLKRFRRARKESKR